MYICYIKCSILVHFSRFNPNKHTLRVWSPTCTRCRGWSCCQWSRWARWWCRAEPPPSPPGSWGQQTGSSGMAPPAKNRYGCSKPLFMVLSEWKTAWESSYYSKALSDCYLSVVEATKHCQTFHPCLNWYLYKLLRNVCPNVVPWQGGYVASVPAKVHFTGTLLQQGEHWTNQSSVLQCLDQYKLSIAQWTNERLVLQAGYVAAPRLSSHFLLVF